MLALTTCCLMTLTMGTLHAWSVFSANLERTLELTRAQSSLVYSLTLVVLTLTVLFAVPMFEKLKPRTLFALAPTVAGIGLLLASTGSFVALLVGYSLLFGIANGLGYGYALQLSARVFSHRSGLAMGVTTAAYALGATLGAQILGMSMENYGSLQTFRLQGISFLILAPVLASLIIISKSRYSTERDTPEPRNYEFTPVSTDDSSARQNLPSTIIDRTLINRYRISYGLAVFAGLMAMAHATPFIHALQSNNTNFNDANSVNFALSGTIVLGIGNAVGGVSSGIAADRFKPNAIIIALPLIAAISLALAASATNAIVALTTLIIIGFTYGALIAVYPVAIARQFGTQASASAYGRIFLAWGIAGLLAPIVAGVLYDTTNSYRYAMLLAMVMSLLSSVTARAVSR